MKYFILISLILNSLVNFAQDSLVLQFRVSDDNSMEALQNAVLSFNNKGKATFLSTNKEGIAYFKGQSGNTYQFSISHPIYEPLNKNIQLDKPRFGDTLRIEIMLKALPFQSEREVVVKPAGVPDTVFQSRRLSVADFEIMADGRLILLAYPKRLEKGSELILYDGSRVQNSFQVPERASGLTRDYRGNAHILCEKNVYGIQLKGNRIGISTLDPEYFFKYIAPIVDTNQSKMYFSTFASNYPAFDYFNYDQTDSTYTKITHVEDTLMMELYRSEYKWVDVRTKLWAKNKELETGIDAEIWVGANYFTQSIYYKELYAPMFYRNDSIFVFDYYRDKLLTFDAYGNQIDSIGIYHHYHPKASGWKKNVIQDKSTGQIFAVYEKAGYSYIAPINVKTGEIKEKIRLENRYVDKIDINNNFVYYVYRPFESLQKKFLYRERMPYNYGNSKLIQGNFTETQTGK